MIYIIALSTFVATLLGGAFALALRDRLHLILGFSAGAVVAVAFFDLLPEAFELAGSTHDASWLFTLTAVGFVAYLIMDRLVLLHGHNHDHDEKNPHEGEFGAGALSLHSFLDGVGIGLAFQVSPAVGIVVAAAVLAHDFSDGVNTVNMILKGGGKPIRAFRWLIVDALAPVAGIAATLFFAVPEVMLGQILAVFAGFFLYIGASDLVPESHHAHPAHWTTISTVLGMLVLYLVILIAA